MKKKMGNNPCQQHYNRVQLYIYVVVRVDYGSGGSSPAESNVVVVHTHTQKKKPHAEQRQEGNCSIPRHCYVTSFIFSCAKLFPQKYNG